MTIDTNRTIEFEASPLKMLGLSLLGMLMTALSAAIVFGVIPGVDRNDWRYWAIGFGVAFFGVGTLLLAWRALTARGPIVTLGPDGISDIRIASRPIPWSAIRGVSTWQYRRQKVMVLAVDPAVEADLPLSAMARWTRQANKALGADGLCVAANGLKVRYGDLLAATEAYLAARDRRT